MRRASMHWRWVAALVLLVGLVAGVQWKVGWVEVLTAWSRVTPVDALVVVGLTAIGYFARAQRLAAHFGSPVREHPWHCLRIVSIHNAANNILPMRTGEVGFPLLLKQTFGLRIGPTVASLLWLRLLDVLSLGLVVMVTLGVAHVGWALSVIGAVLVVLGPWGARSLLRRPWATPHFAARTLSTLREGLPGDGRAVLGTQVWSLVHWGSKLAAYTWLLVRLGDVAVPTATLAAVAGEATSVLPVHGFAGAGTYEAGVLAVLRPLGVPWGQAVQAAVNLHLFLLAVSVVAAALALMLPGRVATAESRP
ncbi:MAG TPA: lysylphosphatidylglycerol synthase transmembrane domain-containing protein [Candidatus Krumholzibacteria bacterium]|nr:lysylphosphatidylglycerol synthase transmembrane domain-containing protein [Candidatus Krumholzibacteria bacterium]